VPDVSVVIPTYNRHPFLKEAISSCFEGNDELGIEVVVVDDGSSDGTGQWLKNLEDPRVRPVFQKHQGAQQARNAGLRAAEGETIKFLDSDDYLYSGILSAQWKALDQSGADLCYGPIDIINGEGQIVQRKENKEVDDLLIGVAHGTVTTYPHVFLYRQELAQRECWRSGVPYHQDTVYALDISVDDPTCVRHEACVGVHRAHDETRITTTKKKTPQPDKIEEKFNYLYESFLRRCRKSSPNDEVRRAVAQGLWTEAHKIAPYDFNRFTSLYQAVRDVDPDFLPSRPNFLLASLDALLGPFWTERLVNPVRKTRLRE
jgi:glycosyltransferase involved in cell wall biosynthesis